MLLSLAISVLAVSCTGDEPSVPDPPAAPTPQDQSPQGDRGDGERAKFDPTRLELDLQPVATGLSSPLGVTAAGDGSGRLFVIEQGGTIRIVEDGEVVSRPFLDVSDRVQAGGEQGLLGLAFHPGFADNGRLFVNYTDTSGDTVIAEFQSRPGADTADGSSQRVLMKIEQPYSNHNGGHLVFGPDGYLYIATGDGGGAGDPQNNGQNKKSLLGKLLRIDVDSKDAYGTPDGNPFGQPSGADEVWAYGLRNPWRFSFDEEAGTLWIADVGQDAFEEVNRVPADEPGLNFGWNEMEASSCFEGDCDPSGKVIPITEYGAGQGCAITGGYVYRGDEFDDMRGGYFFGDFCSGTIWAIDAAAEGRVDPVQLLGSDRSISSFGVDESGEMYLTDLGAGELLRLVDRG